MRFVWIDPHEPCGCVDTITSLRRVQLLKQRWNGRPVIGRDFFEGTERGCPHFEVLICQSLYKVGHSVPGNRSHGAQRPGGISTQLRIILLLQSINNNRERSGLRRIKLVNRRGNIQSITIAAGIQQAIERRKGGFPVGACVSQSSYCVPPDARIVEGFDQIGNCRCGAFPLTAVKIP